MRRRNRRSRQDGSAIVVLLVSVMVCGAVSAAVVSSNVGRRREATSELARESAFQLAEAGIDWGVAQIRIANGVVPSDPVTRTAAKAGTFTVRYAQGDRNGIDDNGDGVVDDVAEHDFAMVTSTGVSGGVRRTLQVLLRRAVEVPTFGAPVQFNVEAPVIDLDGNAFTISGKEHHVDGTPDTTLPPVFGIASPASASDLVAQIESKNYDQVTGAGATPSVGQVAPIDIGRLMEQAAAAADTLIDPGTYSDVALGTATSEGIVSAYCEGDLHLSGNFSGAGILAVDGDLEISGAFTWTGIVMVRGRVRFTGGGSTKRVIGVLAVGEELVQQDEESGGSEVSIAGTVDFEFSSVSIGLASDRLATLSVMSWREVGNP